uniref:Uncharacterized protein n=1 Tax=Hippocampus comes TaxID=109280 RepID=A0A3Q3DFH9_HIPCM
MAGAGGDMQWCFSQVKGAIDDDVAEGMRKGKILDGFICPVSISYQELTTV